MNYKPNILFVCGRNKKRSRTAEHIFKNDPRFNVRSAGLSPSSDHKINSNDLGWANLVLVMETNHRNKLRALFPEFETDDIEILHIPDDFEFMNEELVEILNEKVNAILQKLDAGS